MHRHGNTPETASFGPLTAPFRAALETMRRGFGRTPLPPEADPVGPAAASFDEQQFRHLGGGRKGLFLILRYVFIIAASYLLIFERQAQGFAATHALMIALALASNVLLSLVPQHLVFAWYVEAPILIADTLWVSWALSSTGTAGQEFFLLYFFVLFLAMLGENILMVLLGSTLVSVANVYFSPTEMSSPYLLRVAFFYAVALFYGHVVNQIKRQRQRADKGFAWAKELEAKVAERTARLSQLYDEACAASRLKSEFVNNMSHELRTPLNIIIGYTQLLLEDRGLPEHQSEPMLRRVLEAARSQARLVETVLDLGRAESGEMSVDNEPLLLDRFAAQLQQRQRPALAAGVTLDWHLQPGLPLIETDPVKLGVILDSLIDNAVKFTSAGSIAVTIRALPDKQQVEFHVDDTGPGIDDQDLPVIFEAFRQVDGSTTSRHGGVGLGLAIVDKYTQLLGGTIAVRSVVGTGTNFVLSLPYRPRREQRPHRSPGSTSPIVGKTQPPAPREATEGTP